MQKALAAVMNLTNITEARRAAAEAETDPDAIMAAPSLTGEAAEEAARVAESMPAASQTEEAAPVAAAAQPPNDAAVAVANYVFPSAVPQAVVTVACLLEHCVFFILLCFL